MERCESVGERPLCLFQAVKQAREPGIRPGFEKLARLLDIARHRT